MSLAGNVFPSFFFPTRVSLSTWPSKHSGKYDCTGCCSPTVNFCCQHLRVLLARRAMSEQHAFLSCKAK